MGSGIAQLVASKGIPAVLYELSSEVLGRAREGIGKQLQKLVSAGKITENEMRETVGRINFTSDFSECRADLIIEAIIENLDAKCHLFNLLYEINNGDAIFTTNTSSLPVTGIAERIVKARERIAGMHFFNPAPVMKLVEIVRTPFVSSEILKRVASFAQLLGKTPVICNDSPGFIVNRVARPYYIESLRLVEEGLADFETIDAIMESAGFRMGPFKLMDLIGNDINYAVSSIVYEQMQRPNRLMPSYIQEEKVKQGELGKKTGKGYYQY
jgi:3-hydroxybutyryl-CoA dehydrogenase